MNSLWNNNLRLFKERFPQLYTLVCGSIDAGTQEPQLPPRWQITQTRSGAPTVRDAGTLLHSAYDPEREAERTVQAALGGHAGSGHASDQKAAVFLGFGAGYLPAAWAKACPGGTLILVEPDPAYFLAALTLIDWAPVLTCRDCVLLTGCDPQTVLPFLEKAGLSNCTFFSIPAQTAHNAPFFQELSALIERNKHKQEINTNTLERFSSLWLKNSCKNLRSFVQADGISIYAGKAAALPAVVLAAGPSLDTVLPHLAAIKDRALIICVDTALRACLRAGVEPDFIILVDPQYWAARHILDLAAPSSVLVTESAVYPPVYRFACRKVTVCSSLFPLGTYFERRLGTKGRLESGGSVATSAWDFARFIGCTRIYMAGLDLGYPGNTTHIKGSTFEEAVHRSSGRLRTPDTDNARVLFSAVPGAGTAYDGTPMRTDRRMQLFAWWFESNIAKYPDCRTSSLSEHSLRIPGITCCTCADVLSLPVIPDARTRFFTESEQGTAQQRTDAAFNDALQELRTSFDGLYRTAQNAEQLCTHALEKQSPDYNQVFAALDAADKAILTSSSKDTVSLVFPTEKQLAPLLSGIQFADPRKTSVARSRVIYRQLCRAVNDYRNALRQNSI